MKYATFEVLVVLSIFVEVQCLSCEPCHNVKCPKVRCPGSKVPDLCRCCERCAKQIGKRCGGEWDVYGICEPNLVCRYPDHEYHGPVIPYPSIYLDPFEVDRFGTCQIPANTCSEVCALRKPKKLVGLSRSAKKGFMKGEGGNGPYSVYCDCSEKKKNAWMVIQRRNKNACGFDKNMYEYRSGFGYVNADFWLGLDRINMITESQPHEIKVIVKYESGMKLATTFSEFKVGNRSSNYKLHLAVKDGDRGRHVVSMHSGMAFTTNDEDHDYWIYGNCAKMYGGGWWFRNCTEHNLNGRIYVHDTFFMGPKMIDELSGGPDRLSWGSCTDGKVTAAEIWIRPTTPAV